MPYKIKRMGDREPHPLPTLPRSGYFPAYSSDALELSPFLWGATGQLSGIWLGLWVSTSGGAAQSASMFISRICPCSSALRGAKFTGKHKEVPCPACAQSKSTRSPRRHRKYYLAPKGEFSTFFCLFDRQFAVQFKQSGEVKIIRSIFSLGSLIGD